MSEFADTLTNDAARNYAGRMEQRDDEPVFETREIMEQLVTLASDLVNYAECTDAALPTAIIGCFRRTVTYKHYLNAYKRSPCIWSDNGMHTAAVQCSSCAGYSAGTDQCPYEVRFAWTAFISIIRNECGLPEAPVARALYCSRRSLARQIVLDTLDVLYDWDRQDWVSQIPGLGADSNANNALLHLIEQLNVVRERFM